MKTFFARFLLAAVLLLGLASSARAADDLASVKTRVSQRLPQLDALKSKGALGENNQGYVEVRPGAPADAADLCNAENTDRKFLYAELAKRTSTSIADAGKARAKQIAANSAKGVWVQDDKGVWAKK